MTPHTLPTDVARAHHLIRTGRSVIISAVALLSLITFTQGASAATYTWDGGANGSSTTNWSAGSSKYNWTNANVPAANTTNSFIFSGSTRTTNNNNITGLGASSILFDTSAGAFVIGGNSLTLSGGVTNNSANLQTINMQLILATNVIFNTASNNLLFGGIISGGFGITLTGTNTTTLGASNSYTGGTTLNAGTLAISNNYALGTGTLTFASNSTTLQALANLTITNNIALTANGIFDSGTFTLTNSGIISGTGALIKTNTGNLVLSGVNTFSGGVTIGQGTITMGNAAALGSVSNDITVRGTLNLSSNNATINVLLGSGSVINSVGTNNLSIGNNNGSGTFTGTISNAIVLIKSGTGTQALTSSNSYTGGTTLNAGTLAISNNTALGTGTLTFASNSTTLQALANLTVSNAFSIGSGITATVNNGGFTLADSNAISGSGTVTFAGAGATTLGASNNYSGGTILTEGTLVLNNTYALGATNASLNVAAGILTNNSFNIAVGNVTLGNGSITGNGTLSTTNFTATNTLAALVSQSLTGSGGITKSGTGTLTLAGNNSYTGRTFLSSGTTVVGNTNALGSNTNALSNNGTLNLAGFSLTQGSLAGSGAVTNGTAGNSTLTLGGNNSSTAFSGSVLAGTGTISLVKNGTGTFTLSGSNNYVGTTLITNGALALNGTNSGTGTITVATNATLIGTGSAAANVTLLSGGSLTPGNSSSIGTLTVAGVTFNTGASLNILLGGSSTSLLVQSGTGTSTRGGNLTFSTNSALTTGYYTFMTNSGSGAFSGSFASTNSVPAGYAVVHTTNTSALQQVAVLGTITSSFGSGTNAIITGGSAAFTVGVTNGALTGGSSLVFTGTTNSNTGGSIGSSTVTAQNSTNVSGLSFNGTNVGAAQSGTFTINAPAATLTSGSGTVTVDVYGHASGSLTSSNFTLQSLHVGYTNTQTNNIGVANAAGFRVALQTIATNSSNSLSLGSVSNVSTNASGNALLTFATNQGVGTFTNTIGVVYGDYSTLSGASSSVGTNLLTVSGLVYSGQSYWTQNGTGNWTNFGNWNLSGGTPGLDGALSLNDTATFGTNGSGSVTLNTNASLSALTLSNASSSYALGGTGTITLQAGSNQPVISNLAGSHSLINALALATNVTVTNVTGSSLTLGGDISGGGGLIKNGAGILILTGSNSYTGGTAVRAGRVAFTGAGALSSGAASLSGGASLFYSGSGSAMLTNNISVDSGTGIIGNSSGSLLTLGGTLTHSGSVLEYYGGSYNITGKITGSAANSDLILSNAAVTLSSALNDYNGATKLYSGSTLTAGVANALPTASVLTIGGSGESAGTTNTFNLNGYSQSLGGLSSGTGSYDQILNSGSYALLTLTGDSVFGGSINGNIGLSITNAAVTLTGSNSYTGPTTLNNSSLSLTNSGFLTGTTNIQISTGSTLLLGASNQVNTSASLALNGGKLSMAAADPGLRASAQTFASLTLTASSTIDFGALSGPSSLTFGQMYLGNSPDYTLTVLNWSGTNQWGTTSSGDRTYLYDTQGSLASGNLNQISFYGTSGQFLGTGAFSGNEIVPVPEPGVVIAGLLLLGSLAYGFRGRKMAA